jgi:hypothetical protein
MTFKLYKVSMKKRDCSLKVSELEAFYLPIKIMPSVFNSSKQIIVLRSRRRSQSRSGFSYKFRKTAESMTFKLYEVSMKKQDYSLIVPVLQKVFLKKQNPF